MEKLDQKTLVAAFLIMFYLIVGTVFFHYAEGWRPVDSFYFTGATLTTVGYGDLHPTHDYTKVISVFFMFSGIGIVLYSVSIIGQRYFEQEEDRLHRLWDSTKLRDRNLMNIPKTLVKFEPLNKIASRKK